jgi:hypothetical protein
LAACDGNCGRYSRGQTSHQIADVFPALANVSVLIEVVWWKRVRCLRAAFARRSEGIIVHAGNGATSDLADMG